MHVTLTNFRFNQKTCTLVSSSIPCLYVYMQVLTLQSSVVGVSLMSIKLFVHDLQLLKVTILQDFKKILRLLPHNLEKLLRKCFPSIVIFIEFLTTQWCTTSSNRIWYSWIILAYIIFGYYLYLDAILQVLQLQCFF